MRRFFVFVCLVLLAIATLAAAGAPRSEEARGTDPIEVNGVTPSPTQPPSPTPTPPPP